MSFRDTVKEWLSEGYTPPSNPLCSKRLVIKNLKQILQLLEDESPYIAADRIKFLISDIEDDKLKPGNL